MRSKTFFLALVSVSGVLLNPTPSSAVGRSVRDFSAPKIGVSAPVKKSIEVSLRSTSDALDLPLNNRMAVLLSQGPQGYRNLRTLMFDNRAPMETRWRAVIAAGLIGKRESRPEIERALRSSDWYMRNAGLVAMADIDRSSGILWARKLLSDKAMVVRSAAVGQLADLRDFDSKDLLWQKLYAKENFRGTQSLFIRRRIVEALGLLRQPGDQKRFVEILSDKDVTLHPLAIEALELLTRQTLGSAREPVNFRRERWQKWWQDHAPVAIDRTQGQSKIR